MTVSIFNILSMGKTSAPQTEEDDLQFIKIAFVVDTLVVVAVGNLLLLPYFFHENVRELSIVGRCIRDAVGMCGARRSGGWGRLSYRGLPQPTHLRFDEGAEHKEFHLLEMQACH